MTSPRIIALILALLGQGVACAPQTQLIGESESDSQNKMASPGLNARFQANPANFDRAMEVAEANEGTEDEVNTQCAHLTDDFEIKLPNLGRLILEDRLEWYLKRETKRTDGCNKDADGHRCYSLDSTDFEPVSCICKKRFLEGYGWGDCKRTQLPD